MQDKTKAKLKSLKDGALDVASRVQAHISNPASIVFMVALAVTFIYTVALALSTGGESLKSFMFSDSTDYFMDFFNSMCDSCDDGLYTVRYVIYPPFIEIFFRTITTFVPGGTEMSGAELRNNQTAEIIFVLVFAISLVILGIVVFKSKKGSSVEKLIFTVLIFFSLPVISIIDRGNIIVVAVAFAAIFVRYRNSKNAVLRELSYICLALSAAIKLYPALLVFILVKDKNWWGFLRSAIYIFLFFFLPFFYFGNVGENLSAYMRNVLGWSSITAGEAISSVGDVISFGGDNIISSLGDKISSFGVSLFSETTSGDVVSVSGEIDELYGTLTYTSTFQIFAAFLSGNYSTLDGCTAIANVVIVAMVISGFALKDRRSILVWTILSIAMFKTSYTYSICFLIVPCVLFLNESNWKNPVHWLYAIGFFFLFACFSTETAYWNVGLKGYSIRLGEFMARIGMLFLSVLLVWEALVKIIANLYMLIMLFINDRSAFIEKLTNIKAVKFVISFVDEHIRKR